MATKSIPGQMGLPLGEIGPREPVVLGERRAIAGALDPRHLGHVALEKFTETDLVLVDPSIFQEILFTARSRSESRHVNGLAVNAAEAESVPHSINNLTSRVSLRTRNARARKGDDNANRVERKADKSKTETLKGYLDKEEGVMAGLGIDIEILEKLQEGLRRPGLNRGNEGTLLPRLHYAVGVIFVNMLGVMADELKWNNETREKAAEAMRYQIILAPDRISYLRQITDVALKYSQAKQSIFRGKYGQARTRLEKLTPRVDAES